MKMNREEFFTVINTVMENCVEELETGYFTPIPLTISINGRYTFTDIDAFSWHRLENLMFIDGIIEIDEPYKKDGYRVKQKTVKKFVKYFEKVASKMLADFDADKEPIVVVKLAIGMDFIELSLCAEVYNILMDELNKVEGL